MSARVRPSVGKASAAALLLVLASSSRALALSLPPDPSQCEESAQIQLNLSTTPPAVVKFTVGLKGQGAILVNRAPQCGPPTSRIAMTNFAWRLEPPSGSSVAIQPAGGTGNPGAARFTPERVGRHRVRLVACPSGCTVTLKEMDSHGRLRPTPEKIGPVEKVLDIDVERAAQLPPAFAPRPLPTLVNCTGPNRDQCTCTVPDSSKCTVPVRDTYKQARDACPSTAAIATQGVPQWITASNFDPTRTPPYELAEGFVYNAHPSRKDLPSAHHEHDMDSFLSLDPRYRRLLVDDTAEDKTRLPPFGGIEVEIEFPIWPEAFWPFPGDRMSVLGFHVVDCGHDKYTEIHPLVASAVHRVRPVKLPERVPLVLNGAPQSPGSNVIVPGIVTDVWAGLRGGAAIGCNPHGVHRPSGFPACSTQVCANGVPACVPQVVTTGVNFQFRIYLPPSPAFLLQELHAQAQTKPGLYFEVLDHPAAASLGARTDLQVLVNPRDLETEHPFLDVTIPLSALRPAETFAKRIVAAWVYGDTTGANYGLKALKVRLEALKVKDDADGPGKGNGDWRLWAAFPRSAPSWTRLIDCDGCVDETTYKPGDAPWLPGAMAADGTLPGEMLLWGNWEFRVAGFDDDVVVGDDAGTVSNTNGPGPLSREGFSECDVEEAEVPGVFQSGCGEYSVQYAATPGATPVTGTLSAQERAMVESLFVGASLASQVHGAPPDSLELAQAPPEKRHALTVRRPNEVEGFQEGMSGGGELKNEDLVKSFRDRAQALLGKKPSPEQREDVSRQLRELKPHVSPGLYQKYLCPLETGKPCVAAPSEGGGEVRPQ